MICLGALAGVSVKDALYEPAKIPSTHRDFRCRLDGFVEPDRFGGASSIEHV